MLMDIRANGPTICYGDTRQRKHFFCKLMCHYHDHRHLKSRPNDYITCILVCIDQLQIHSINDFKLGHFLFIFYRRTFFSQAIGKNCIIPKPGAPINWRRPYSICQENNIYESACPGNFYWPMTVKNFKAQLP